MTKTMNPVFRETAFSGLPTSATLGRVMTIEGTIHRTAFLLFCVLATAMWTWNRFFTTHDPGSVLLYGLLGLVGGFPMSIVTLLKKQWAVVTAPVYALFEGLFLGAVSARLESRFPGIPIQAVVLTFGTFFCLLLGYRFRLIRIKEMFRRIVCVATAGVALVYLLNLVLAIAGIRTPLLGGGPAGIIVGLITSVIAALNLIIDFDFVERSAQSGAPKYMEWYAAFGLTVTLIWLYTEIIWLLSKTRESSRESS